MRDAAVYAKEENWSKAVELWKQTYETKKENRKCMQPITPLWATKCKTA